MITVSETIVEALMGALKARGDVDEVDDFLRDVICEVELALGVLRPSPLDVTYAVADGTSHVIQLMANREGRWFIAWRKGLDSSSTPLLSASRAVRLEVFTLVRWPLSQLGMFMEAAPIEGLIITLADDLARERESRDSVVLVAERIMDALSVVKNKSRDDVPRLP